MDWQYSRPDDALFLGLRTQPVGPFICNELVSVCQYELCAIDAGRRDLLEAVLFGKTGQESLRSAERPTIVQCSSDSR